MATPDDRVIRELEFLRGIVATESPLYARLCEIAAADPALQALIAAGTPTQPRVNVFLAAVHYLLLGGADTDLAQWYPSVGGNRPATDDPAPALREFVAGYQSQLAELCRTRSTQTNEAGRAAVLLPALATVAADSGRPLALVEIGTSAGLLLNYDHYHYSYGATEVGPESPVRLDCELRGRNPEVSAIPAAATKIGIDLNPIDATDPDEARWLSALLWPEQERRRDRLAAALTVLGNHPPELRAGDALELAGPALEYLPDDSAAVVFHSFTLNQFGRERSEDLHQLLLQSSRPVYRIWMELIRGDGPVPRTSSGDQSELHLFVYVDGDVTGTHLANIHHHGDWLEWF